MDLSSREEQWAVWTVQARHFAKRENFPDAVARMKLVCQSIEDALTEVSDPRDRQRAERHLARSNELLADVTGQYEAWRDKIAERRQETIDGAAEEMARPIPVSD